MSVPEAERSAAGLSLSLDCRHYRGDRPCAAGVQGACPSGCDHYESMGHRILILKLGALGDVIRTAALLPGLKRQWPESHVTWISRPSGVRMLSGHPLIDRLLPFDAETICHVEAETFDTCLSLDKEPGPAALAMRVRAADRRGVGLSRWGTPFPLNPECNDYFELGLDDQLKFHENRKSYPELIYDSLGLRYAGERYTLHPGPAHERRAAQTWTRLHLAATDEVVGLNTGAGRVFANKNWPADRYVALAQRLLRSGRKVLLLGGADEREKNGTIAAACPGILDAGVDHDELTFAAIVGRCAVVVTGDTMAMHVAIALGRPCVVLFGPTCEQEIDLFGCGEKLTANLECAPCYRRTCDKSPTCMDAIPVERVLDAVERWIAPSPAVRAPAGRRSLTLLVAGRA